MRGRRVFRCAACALAARVTPAGFTSEPYLVCQRTSEEVDGSDGCTFGQAGAPATGAQPYEVDISAHAAINGYCEWE